MRSTEAVLEKPAAADDVPEAVASDDDFAVQWFIYRWNHTETADKIGYFFLQKFRRSKNR